MDNCKQVRDKILDEVSRGIKMLKEPPKLAIIKCNNDFGSEIYVRNKIKTCENAGIKVELFDLNPDETDFTRLSLIILNCNINYNATILQLPLADKFKNKEHHLLNLIDKHHDIDGLTDYNKLALINKDKDVLIPCTALAVFKIIEHELGTTDFSGNKICIINRSDLIGKPLMNLLLNHNATPTICHSKTDKNINDFLYDNKFDVVVTGIGKHIIDEVNMYNTIIIDCGISRDKNNKLLRDLKRLDLEKDDLNNKYYGAVGTVTTACVAYNVLQAYKLQNGK